MLYFRDLGGNMIVIPSSTFSFVEELRIFISNIHTHIEPYTVRLCIDGVFLNKLDKIPKNKVIHIWQTYSAQKYKVSDVFDALSQINGVFYSDTLDLAFHSNYELESSDSEDSFYSVNNDD